MSTMASQITSLTIVYSAVCSGEDQRKHQSSASLAFVLGIHLWPVNSPYKWPVTRKMFSFYDVIIILCICTSDQLIHTSFWCPHLLQEEYFHWIIGCMYCSKFLCNAFGRIEWKILYRTIELRRELLQYYHNIIRTLVSYLRQSGDWFNVKTQLYPYESSMTSYTTVSFYNGITRANRIIIHGRILY